MLPFRHQNANRAFLKIVLFSAQFSNCSGPVCVNSVTQLLLTCPSRLILSVNFTPVQFNSIS